MLKRCFTASLRKHGNNGKIYKKIQLLQLFMTQMIILTVDGL